MPLSDVIPEAGLPEIHNFAGKPSYPGPIVRDLSARPGSRLINLAAEAKLRARLMAGMTAVDVPFNRRMGGVV
jgi:hypothetical protein